MEKGGKDGSYDLPLWLQLTVHFDFSLNFFSLSQLGFRVLCPCRHFSQHVYTMVMAKSPFLEIWKHLFVSSKRWFCWISHRSPSIYTSWFLLFVHLFILESIVLCIKTFYIVLGIGLCLISQCKRKLMKLEIQFYHD